MTLDSRGKLKLYSSISVLTVLVVVFIALIVPKAKVVISLKERQFKKSYSVILDKTISTPLAPINRIPYSALTEPESREFSIAFITEKIAHEIDVNTEQFDKDDLNYTINITDSEHGIATLYVESVIVPKIDMDALKKSIRGKKTKEARDYLASVPYIESAALTAYPEFLGFLPLIEERITVTIID